MRIPVSALVILFCAGAPAHATLLINSTFDPSISSSLDADVIEGAIESAITEIESNVTSTNNLTVSIYFNTMTSGLGESDTSVDTFSYDSFYNALKDVATSPDQLIALASLGTAPTNQSSGNPVNGNRRVQITSAEARNLGFSAPAGIDAGGGTYDSEISLNTSTTSPPGSLNGSTYSLEAVAMHEIDEALGIGGTGSTLTGSGSLTGPVGDLDLFRYSAAGVRSYSNTQTTSPFSYFSIDAGTTILSYFNQASGGDFADWLSNPIPEGFGVQVQDAFGQAGTNPSLGANELIAFNAIGYQLIAPEPPSSVLTGLGIALAGILFRRRLRGSA
ncbi:MAG TPA: NF038122 family metalloprotease [Bryobacteraceae bacterium]|jgi:hypothetical protein